MIKPILIITCLCVQFISCEAQNIENKNTQTTVMSGDKINKPEEEWKKILTPGQFKILREKGTENPYTGKFYKHNGDGTYVCAGCGAELFSSSTKFDAGCGWPSFFESLEGKVDTAMDYSHGMTRIEIKCHRCGGHLGHVFDDGPKPSGLRYCVNSESLDFKKK